MITEKKIASLDIGLSAVMMLIVSCNKAGRFEVLNELGGISRLGYGISKTNSIAPDRIKSTIELCKELVDLASNYGVDKILCTATSGIKNTINKTQFLIECRSNFNIFPNILNEQEEAKLIFKGVSEELKNEEQPIVVIEVGGDSTYITFGKKESTIKSYVLKYGSFYEFDNPHRYSGLLAFLNPKLKPLITAELSNFKNELNSWLEGRKPIFICSGTLASVFYSVFAGKSVLSRSCIEGKKCSLKSLARTYYMLSKKSLEARQKVPGMDPERTKTLPTALCILFDTLHTLGAKKFQLTANGLRTGVLKSYIEKTSFWG